MPNFIDMQMKTLYKISMVSALFLMFEIDCHAAPPLSFTEAELVYIKAHPVIKYGIFPHFYPIESFNLDGKHIGLTRDYIDLIADATGIKFEAVITNTGDESFSYLKNGQIKLLTSTSEVFSKKNNFVSSNPIFSTWPVTITRKTTRNIETSEDLIEGYVSITDYSSLIDWFKDRYPGINYKVSHSPEATINDVVSKRAEAAVVLAPTALYYMNVIYPGQLKMSHPHDAIISLVMSAKQDDRVLIDIINKVMASISPKQQAELTGKWIISNDVTATYKPSIYWLGYALALVLLCLSLFLFYRNRKFKLELISQSSKNNLELSVIAHELRTPLIGILTACEGLIPKLSSASQRERLGNIVHVARELLDNLDLSLDYAKINAGSVQQNPQPNSIAQICDSTVKLFTSFADTCATTLQIRYLSKQCFLPHLIDGTLLSQAVNNIVSNAIKHTHSGMVLIDCSLLRVDGKKMFCIEVTDTGVGIPEKELIRLSEPFYQGKQPNDTGSSRPSGTGLGLFVAKKNMHLMGGHLTIASKQGIGSRVKIAFPIIPAHYLIEDPLPEGLSIILSADIPASLHVEVTQILHGCELPYYQQSDSTPAASAGPVITLHLDLTKQSWYLNNQQGESVSLPRPLYASTLYIAIAKLCYEEQILDNDKMCSFVVGTESRRLLLVEDEPLLLAVQDELFTAMGFKVDSVAETQQAYQSWLEHHHTIIITDCRLDESDGFELVRHLRKLMQDTPQPVLIIGQSASLKAEDAQRAREVGMDYLLQKPIAREQWQQLIHDFFTVNK